MYGADEKLASLVGRVVEQVWVSNEGEHSLVLVTDGGSLELSTEGDCCSESWWADAVGVKQMIDATVTAVQWIDMPTPEDGRTRQEEDQAYGLRITTSQGVCDLIFRNSSNGYYGGWCTPEWHQVEPSDGAWTGITEDWSA